MRSSQRFFLLIAVLAITFCAICALEPLHNDSWRFYVEAKQPVTWQRFVELVEHSYCCDNPRWGQLALWAMFNVPAFAVVVTPLVIVALLLVTMTLIRARWPRPSDPDDAWLVVQVLATALATTPQYGDIWFSRANCANYIYPLVVQLFWLVPYRFLAARPTAISRPLVWACAIVPLGFAAGAGNEHTAIGLALAAALCAYVAWRRDRKVPAWAITGVVALVAGNVFLLTAPGQLVRYGGVATHESFLDSIARRGFAGNATLLALLLAWASPMLVAIALVGGRSLMSLRWLGRMPRRLIAACVAIALVMVATVLVAPRVPVRVLVAPATLVALALGVFMVELATDRGKRRRLRIASLVISSSALCLSLAIFVVTGIEGRRRVRAIESAPQGSSLCVEPYTFAAPTPFSWGDDFRTPSMTRRVGWFFGLDRLEVCR